MNAAGRRTRWSLLVAALFLMVLLVGSAPAAQEPAAGVTRRVDQILEGGKGQVPRVSAKRRAEARARLNEASELRRRTQDKAWVVWRLDSLRRAGVADSAAWYDLYDKALRQVQSTLTLTNNKYPGDMSARELAGVKESLRRQAAEGYRTSLGLLESALAANPWDDSVLAAIGGVLEDLARLYTSLNFRDRAIELTQKRLALDASNYFAHWDLADLLRAAGRQEAALERYQKACRALRAFAFEDEGGSEDRPVGRRRQDLVLLLRERVNLAMDLQNEGEFRQAMGEWEPLADASDQKELAQLKLWLQRGGGRLGQALRIDKAWKLIEQGREIEARELLQQAVAESVDPVEKTRNVLALSELEFDQLEMKEAALTRVSDLLREGVKDESLRVDAQDARGRMTLSLAADLEEEDPQRAWSLLEESLGQPGRWETALCLRLAGLLLNRPEEALPWLERAEAACRRGPCDGADKSELYHVQADVYRRLGQADKAREALQKASGVTP
jgi:tetratricopeptide (TPR) repeat protein